VLVSASACAPCVLVIANAWQGSAHGWVNSGNETYAEVNWHDVPVNAICGSATEVALRSRARSEENALRGLETVRWWSEEGKILMQVAHESE
jgi:hypothetical protein